MRNLILTLPLFLFACGTQKDVLTTSSNDFSTKNDTIFHKSEPSAVVVHYGWVVDKNNNNNQLIVIKDINVTEEITMDVIKFVHKMHPNSIIEYRSK